MRIKQSICYPLFKPQDMGLETLFKTAAEIGYAAAELHRDLQGHCGHGLRPLRGTRVPAQGGPD